MKRALVIYNPAAGRFPVKPFTRSIERELVRVGWRVDLVETKSGQHAVELGKQAAVEKYEAAFAVGGDGTVGQIASGLAGSDTALGILPAGTSNVWAHELGLIPFSWARWRQLQINTRILANSRASFVDMGQCNQHTFMMWAGFGLDAMAIHAIEPRVRLEKFFAMPEYAATTIRKASQWRGIQLHLWADGKELEGQYILAVANNIRHYMGGLSNLSPDAYLDDGLLDLWLFSGHSLADALRHAYDLWRGRHINSSAVRRIPFQTLLVQASSPFFVQMDGEPKESTNEVTISVHKQILKVLMPPQSLMLLSKLP